ncbi:MAG: hypothetical protein WB460_04050 [Candidatus Acidiferrales bacterium]
MNGLKIRRHAVKIPPDQQVDRLLTLEGWIGAVQVAPNGFVIRKRLFKQGNKFKEPVQFLSPTGTRSLEPTMRRPSRNIHNAAKNLLRQSQESDDLGQISRPAMASGLECAQAVQLFEQRSRLHFGIKEHEDRSRPRLAKHFDRFFSIKAGHANVHQDDVWPFSFNVLDVS